YTRLPAPLWAVSPRRSRSLSSTHPPRSRNHTHPTVRTGASSLPAEARALSDFQVSRHTATGLCAAHQPECRPRRSHGPFLRERLSTRVVRRPVALRLHRFDRRGWGRRHGRVRPTTWVTRLQPLVQMKKALPENPAREEPGCRGRAREFHNEPQSTATWRRAGPRRLS